MLDAFIIEKIKEREKDKQQEDNRMPLYIEEHIPDLTKEKEDIKKEPVVIQL